MQKQKLISFLLRLGIAFSFFYAAIASFLNPTAWIGFFPSFLQYDSLLTVYSIFEIILGGWLLLGKKVFYAAVLSALTLFGIVVFNLGALDIVFRDIPILFAAIALAVLGHEE